jgi:hypothetical protein
MTDVSEGNLEGENISQESLPYLSPEDGGDILFHDVC